MAIPVEGGCDPGIFGLKETLGAISEILNDPNVIYKGNAFRLIKFSKMIPPRREVLI